MDDNGAGNRPSWWMLTIIVIVAIQAAGFGIWIGNIQTEVATHEKWINGRDTKNFDVRLGVLEIEEATTVQSVQHLSDELSTHIATDNIRIDQLNAQHRQFTPKP